MDLSTYAVAEKPPNASPVRELAHLRDSACECRALPVYSIHKMWYTKSSEGFRIARDKNARLTKLVVVSDRRRGRVPW